MPSISLQLPQAGQKITAGLHITNYTALQTLLNGGLDGTNLDDMGATAGQALVWSGSVWAPSTVQGIPTAGVIPYAGAAAPTGFLMSDGASYLRADFPTLFSALGGTGSPFGLPDGTHFNVPDLRQRIPVGKHASGTFATLGATGGVETHALSTAELASHSHGAGSYAAASHDHGGGYHDHGITAANAGHVHNTEGWSSTVSATWVDYGGGGGYPLFNSVDTHSHYWGPYQSTGEYGGSGADVHANWANITAQAPAVGGTSSTAGSGTAHTNLQPYIVLNYIIKT